MQQLRAARAAQLDRSLSVTSSDPHHSLAGAGGKGRTLDGSGLTSFEDEYLDKLQEVKQILAKEAMYTPATDPDADIDVKSVECVKDTAGRMSHAVSLMRELRLIADG